ncbi:MAG: hypothetical protein ABTA16_18890, partial [Niallia sp.]
MSKNTTSNLTLLDNEKVEIDNHIAQYIIFKSNNFTAHDIAKDLRVSTKKVREKIRELNIPPATIKNNLSYYSHKDILNIRKNITN